MGSVNSVPVVSQAKSGILLLAGDKEEARQVQKDFLHECPGFSQATAAVYYMCDDKKRGKDTFRRGAECLSSMADSIPIVGHIKDRGDAAMYSATRTAAVIGGGIGGALVAGPVGAVAGGIAAGTAADGVAGAIKEEPCGHIAAVIEVLEKPTVSNVFDTTVGIVFDGLLGHAAGSYVSRNAGKMSRTQYRRYLRKKAAARAKGLPPPKMPAAAPGKPAGTPTEWSRFNRKTARAHAKGTPFPKKPPMVKRGSPFGFCLRSKPHQKKKNQ